MGPDTRALGWDYSFSNNGLPNKQIRRVGGYKRDKLISVLSALCREELGGSLEARVTLEEAYKVVGRLIHVSDIAWRLEGFNAWKQLKYRLVENERLHNEEKARQQGPTGEGPYSVHYKLNVWRNGATVPANCELRLESERLLAYIYAGEKIECPVSCVKKSNRYVMYYDASLTTLACWFAHPDLTTGYYLDAREVFNGFHISALELITMVWGLYILAQTVRDAGVRGPLLLVPYGDNSSVPLVVHKTFAKSFGMEFVLDAKKRISRMYDIDILLNTFRVCNMCFKIVPAHTKNF